MTEGATRSTDPAPPRRDPPESAHRGDGISWALRLRCTRSGSTAELDGPAALSPAGAPWQVVYGLDAARGAALRQSLGGRPWTLWRYRELLPLADFAGRVDLGEGGTPLVRVQRSAPADLEVWVKEEKGNPSGSFKDRGLSLAVNRARELAAPGVQLASAGNAALSVATYAAAAGIPCRVALPEDTPTTVERRCRLLGAEVAKAPGTLVEARALLAAHDDGYVDLSTFREPYRVEGKKTMGLELAEQLSWRLPDWILYPTGGGTGIVGMRWAFDQLEALGLIGSERPRFAVVQMAGCAPLVRAFERGAEAAEPWANADTSVWGLRVPRALADFLVLAAVRESGGVALAVGEDEVAPATAQLARHEGMLFGPEGAACWVALDKLRRRGVIRAGQRVVLFQTGHPANYLD